MGILEALTNGDDASTVAGIPTDLLLFFDIGQHTFAVVDQALGIAPEKMEERLTVLGSHDTNREGHNVRGHFSRGAKDLSELGIVTFTSFYQGQVSALTIYRDFTYEWRLRPQTASPALRQRFGINENGLHVQVQVEPFYWPHDMDAFVDRLPKYVGLRLLLSHPAKKVTRVTLDHGVEVYRAPLRYEFPKGKRILEVPFRVQNYGAKAFLHVYRADEPLPQEHDPAFREYGILVRSDTTAYAVELFRDDIAADPKIHFIYGELRTNHPQVLMEAWDRGENDDRNPFEIIKPTRDGLHFDHPFTTQLYLLPILRLRNLLITMSSRSLDRQRTLQRSAADEFLQRFDAFGTSILTTSEQFSEFRSKVDGDIIQALHDTNAQVEWVERTAEEHFLIDTATGQSVAGGVVLDADDQVGNLFHTTEVNAFNGIQQRLEISDRGELVAVDEATGKVSLSAKREFQLRLHFDEKAPVEKAASHLQSGYILHIFIHMLHPLVQFMLNKDVDTGEVYGLENPAAQMMTAYLVARVLATLIVEGKVWNTPQTHIQTISKVELAANLQELQKTKTDIFVLDIYSHFQEFLASAQQ
jgi:hypothetical protein